MTTTNLPNIPSLRKQQLYLEFSDLKSSAAIPDGLYLSLTPNKPSLWTGSLFVRSGPYAGLIARLSVTFPNTYPDILPLVVFHTEIFHPLVVPLTTYTYSTGVDSSGIGTVSANDEERLPPGAFALAHGFPAWVGEEGRKRRSRLSRDLEYDLNRQGSPFGRSISPIANLSAKLDIAKMNKVDEDSRGDAVARDRGEITENSSVQPQGVPQPQSKSPGESKKASISMILKYIVSTFSDAVVLDSVPLSNAGNPGAWHAWRAYRGLPKYIVASPQSSPVGSSSLSPSRVLKQPGEWNWDGVWESRVKSQIELSQSESVLYGGRSEGIRFREINTNVLEKWRREMLDMDTGE